MSTSEKNDLLICAFLQRLKSIQRLCCSNNTDLPDALLFIPGQDGRHNKGSSTVLKYLFQGSVGKELFEGVLDSSLECLEETALLIQESSVSIFYSSEAKKIIGPLLSCCPLLIEYITTLIEEEEVDLFQARKCVDFKRMLLESVPEGGVIGMPVPIGYDEVQDTETWPLLQSFALDDVYCSTGFFSARYAIVDVTDHLNIIFNTIDSFYIEKALTVIHQSILPHTLQTLSILEVTNAEQRERMTIDTILSPFDLLFEFGDMEATIPVDPALQPVLLPGVMSAYLGSPVGSFPLHWKQQLIGNALHTVIEGYEPSTGMRWCRTYFLRTTSTIIAITNTDQGNITSTTEHKPNESTSIDNGDNDQDEEQNVTATILLHLEFIYMKLWLGLRYAVTVAFQNNHDVLEAGKEVQDIMESLLHPTTPSSSSDNNLQQQPIHQIISTTTTNNNNKLKEELNQYSNKKAESKTYQVKGEREVLQVHMDCMDGSGKVVSIDDVDDMGGQCWVYIRVSIHGIQCGLDRHELGSVAVGDTFLFTSKIKHLHDLITSTTDNNNSNKYSSSSSELLLTGLVTDKYCLTHSLPYFRQYVGSGDEEIAAHELNAQIRNNHMLSTLGMGSLLNSEDNNEVVLPVVLDHFCYPLITAELRLFTTGFVIQRMDHITCLPVIISISEHVERVWTIDTDSCWKEVNKLGSFPQNSKSNNITNTISTTTANSMSTQYLPEGFFIIFQLKKELSLEQLELLLVQEIEEKNQRREEANKKKKRIIQDEKDEEKENNSDSLESKENMKEDDEERDYEDEVEDEEEMITTLDSDIKVYKNPLKASLPEIYRKEPPRHLALLIREDSREFPMLSRVINGWRKAFREYDIEEHRGASLDSPLPVEILDSLLCAVNQWSVVAERKELAEERINLPLVPAKELVVTGLKCNGQISQLSSGFASLRCFFALSQSLQDTAYTRQLVQSLESHKISSKKSIKVILLFGLPGSGVVSVAYTIYSRLSLSSERSTTTSANKHFQVLDLASYDIEKEKDTLDLNNVVTSILETVQGKVIVIAVILPVTFYLSTTQILQHIYQVDQTKVVWAGTVLSTGATTYNSDDSDNQQAAHVTPKTTSDSILSALQPDRDPYKEIRRSIAYEPLATGICDTVFIIDNKINLASSGSCYDTCKADVESRSSNLDICRLNIGTLFIDESIMETISNSIINNTTTNSNTTQKSCLSLLRCDSNGDNTISYKRQSYFDHSLQGLGIRCIPITLNSYHNGTTSTTIPWDFSLLSYCLQKVFPTATSHSLLATQDKYYYNNSNSNSCSNLLNKRLESLEGFQKIVFSSKVKVMKQRQQIEGKKQLEQIFHSFNEKDIIRLQSTIMSIHGLFTTSESESSEDMISLEGCVDSIIIKSVSISPSTSISFRSQCNQLLIYGAFHDNEIKTLTTLLQHCHQVELSYRKLLTEDDLSDELKTKLQEDTTLDIPLPSGWWFDGNAYIDIHGTRKNIRPDIGVVVKVYLEKRNRQVKAYNEILKEVFDLL